MADIKDTATLKAGWEKFRTWAEEQWKVLGVAGGFGYVVWALAQDEESRKVFLEFIELGENLYNKANEIYQKLRRGLMAVIGIVVGSNLVMLYQGYHMNRSFASGPLLYSIQHSRGIVEVLLGLALSLLLFDFGLRVLPALFGADILKGWFGKPVPNEGLLERTLRLLGKYAGWLWIGVVLLVVGEWHNKPVCLVIATACVPVAIFMCNAWKAGKSEHFRRTVIWFVALLIINCMAFAGITPALVAYVKAYPDESHRAGLGLLLFGSWAIQAIMAVVLGNWQTKADKARDQFVTVVAADQVAGDLNDLDKAKAVMSAAGIQPSGGLTHPSTTNMTPGGYLYPSQRLAKTQSSPLWGVVGALIVIGVVVLWVQWMIQVNAMATQHVPMIPSNWMYDGQKTWEVFGMFFLVVLGLAGVAALLARRR